MTGRIRGSESPISQPVGLVVSDFRSGGFGEVRAFATWDQALKAVRLEEEAMSENLESLVVTPAPVK